jgi:hypothetical protein
MKEAFLALKQLLDANGVPPQITSAIGLSIILAICVYLGVSAYRTSRESWLTSTPYRQGQPWNYDRKKVALICLVSVTLYTLLLTIYSLVTTPRPSILFILGLDGGIILFGFLLWSFLMGWLYFVRRRSDELRR